MNHSRKQIVFKRTAAKQSSTIQYMLFGITCLIFVGLFFCATFVPGEESLGGGLTINSIISKSPGMMSLSERIKTWIPKHHVDPSPDVEEFPNWGEEFWTPIDVEVSNDPIIVLCKLNFQQYYEGGPHQLPMFKDLVAASSCRGNNRRRENLSVLMKEIKDQKEQGLPGGNVVPPTGFVFHESRVGSTLMANFLASDPFTMVFSESTPMANALLHCGSCSKERQLQLIRDVVTLMGRSPIHKRLFFKCQSITTTKMEYALEAFPETPWAFVFRQPVQTMMSHLDPKKGGGSAPCLRSKRNPPKEVSDALASQGGKRNAPNEAWCAAHLNMLCQFAIDAYDKYSTMVDGSGNTVQRGMLVNYDSLPGFMPKTILPLFHSLPDNMWLRKIEEESRQYSKSRGPSRGFSGDSQDKDERATENIQLYANKILMPTYELLNSKAEAGFKYFQPTAFVEAGGSDGGTTVDWKSVNVLPHATVRALEENDANAEVKAEVSETVVGGVYIDEKKTRGSSIGHSELEKKRDFKAWIPFANTHSSRPMEMINCPQFPPPGYPTAYSMIDITNNWNTDNTDIPPTHYDSLCHFDYQNKSQQTAAYNYREAELPFVAYNIPELDEVAKKWSNVDYLQKMLGTKKYRTETSDNNHFMYWRNAGGGFLRSAAGKAWTAPTAIINEQFESWLELAVRGQNKSLDVRKHEYFRVSSDGENHFLFKELPFFQPKKNLFLVNPKEQKGIHCRFGMRSIIAEAHFDGSRNTVVMLGGLRRWILTHPDQCVNMHMLPPKHPSGRHSAVDWSKPDIEAFPNFAKIMGNEVILAPGDFLFVPTYWIHYIVSLNVNFQCNTRSGFTPIYDTHIRKCNF